mgnify:FL=1
MTAINSHERVLVAIALILFAGVIFYNFLTLSRVWESGGEVASSYEDATEKKELGTTVEKTTTVTEGTVMESSENTRMMNINTASITELTTLPGIGEVKARAIVDYRENHGPFKSVEELMMVSGIGEKTYEKLREKICV